MLLQSCGKNAIPKYIGMNWKEDLVEHFYKRRWENVYGIGAYCGEKGRPELHLTEMFKEAKRDAHLTIEAVQHYILTKADGLWFNREYLLDHLIWCELSPLLISEILDYADQEREKHGNVLSR